REQTLNQLLVCLDGFRRHKGVVVIAATNRADVLDSALLRPGRFDVRLRMPELLEEGRGEVLAIHLRGKPSGKTLSVAAVARETEGYSGAELEHLVNEAAVCAVRRTRQTGQAEVAIEGEDFQSVLASQAKKRKEF